jgi:hypothetical protein
MKRALLMIASTITATQAMEKELPSHSLTPSLHKAVRPSELLPDGQDSLTAHDGTIVRKGSVKATIDNIKYLNELFQLPQGQNRATEIAAVVDVMEGLIKPLHYIELFSFFSPLEWLQDPFNQGRIFITVMYLQQYKNFITHDVEKKLTDLALISQPEVKEAITNALINK